MTRWTKRANREAVLSILNALTPYLRRIGESVDLPHNLPIEEQAREVVKVWYRSVCDTESSKRRLDELNQYLLDLVKSDKPLDRFSRDLIADDLQRFYFPDPTSKELKIGSRKELLKRQNRAAHTARKWLRECGMKAVDAEQDIADEHGISEDGLRSRLKRDPRPDILAEPGVEPASVKSRRRRKSLRGRRK